jgi:hypothetical protein
MIASLIRCLHNGWQNLRIGPYYGVVNIPEIDLGSIIAVLLNSILIVIFNHIYGSVAVALNDAENHRTETEYEDALIVKVFSFSFVNSYGALAYIAFMMQPIVHRLTFVHIYAVCPYGEHSLNQGHACMSQLGLQLFSILAVNMLVKATSNIVLPYLSYSCNNDGGDEDSRRNGKDCESSLHSNELRFKSPVELEFDRPEFDVLMGPFKFYSELAIQFG